MATKDQERKALSHIRKIVEGLGEDSYLSFAFDGAFDDAERNIEDDAGYSYKSRYKSVLKTNTALKEELNIKERENANIIEELGDINSKIAKRVSELQDENEHLKNEISALIETRTVNRYDVYLDDGDCVYKVSVPARSEDTAREYVNGNGDIIAVKLNQSKMNKSNICEALHDRMKQSDALFITRLLEEFGFAE